MVRVFLILLAALTWLNLNTKAVAQDFESLLRGFNASTLTSDDKRFLQAALAFEGHYNGLLDGDWGRLSRDALSTYSWKEFKTGSEEWHMAMLAFSLFEEYRVNGWEQRYFDTAGMSFLIPTKASISDPPTSSLANWRHSQSSLAYSVGINDVATAQRFHDFTLRQHESADKPYSVRRPDLAITRATKRNGQTLYTRSNFVNGSWTTILLSVDRADVPILNAVASSITVGRSRPIIYTNGGRLDEAIKLTLAALNEPDDQQGAQVASRAEPDDPPSGGSAGTGFIVSREGHILTNAHVVEGCSTIFVNGAEAKLVDASKEFDLAIIQANALRDGTVAQFSANPARLNSDVTVIGYPYAGKLSGLNVTRGSVSSLKGLAGNATTMQITAPVQSGNSGGPLVGPDGQVVGVIVSKLNALKFSDTFGDLPQNVNFAVRGEIAKLFLAQNGVDPTVAAIGDTLTPVDLADRASAFTTFIECQ